MLKRLTLVGLITLAVTARHVHGDDLVFTRKSSVSGTITAMSPTEVSVKRTGDKIDKIPVNEIKTIRFDGEPAKLNIARTAVANGRYQDALTALAEVEKETITRDEIKQELEFYKSYANGRMALAGIGSARDAGRSVRTFVTQYPNSFHLLDAAELLGDLFVAVNAYDDALTEYAKVGNAPWPDYRMRSAVAKARVFRAQRRFPEAIKAYDDVLAAAGSDTNELMASQRLAATLGKAECLTETEQYEPAIQLVEGVIQSAAPEETEMHARAYNTMGACLKKAGRTTEALLAYLHVELLYYSAPGAHAEALKNLAELWTAVNQPQRAAQALQTLEEKYPSASRAN